MVKMIGLKWSQKPFYILCPEEKLTGMVKFLRSLKAYRFNYTLDIKQSIFVFIGYQI